MELISEIGQAHDGSLGTLYSYIDSLKKCGIKIIKFQIHIPEAESSEFEKFRVNFSYQDKTRFDYWKRTSFSEDEWINIKKYCEIDSIRGLRYFGPSQMSLFKLLVHSFSIIAVFKYQVFFRSVVIIVILNFFNIQLGNISIFFQILLLVFNLIILIVSFREKREELNKSHTNLLNVVIINNH